MESTAVTGATGHIGANLIRELLISGKAVRTLVRGDLRAVSGLDVEPVTGDILNPDSLLRLFRGVETVFHLAARISINGDEGGMVERINVDGTRNVVEACIACGVRRLVHFSSIHAYSSGTGKEEINENQTPALEAKHSAYDRTKAAGEIVVRSAIQRGLEAVIVNPTAIIGPYDFKPSRMGEVLLGLYHRRFSLLIDGGYNWVDARDVARGAITAGERGRSSESYVLAGHWAHFRELAAMVKNAAGTRSRSFFIPLGLAAMTAPAAAFTAGLFGRSPKFTPESIRVLRGHRNVSSAKAARELGFASRPLQETVRDTFDWFRRAGMMD